MRILICLYSINNYGGITTYVEHLNRGFRKLGHQCDLVLLAETDRKMYVRRHSKRPGNSDSSWSGLTVNSDTGWGGVPVMSYANLDRIKEFRKYARGYDLVIWGVPVPSWSKLSTVPKWQSLYRLGEGTKQIAIIHDGNFRYLYPHLNAVAPYLDGVACVHGAAFHSASEYDGRYSLIPNPHPLLPVTDWDEKKPLVACAHMWKGWKHMELAVKAAPLLKESHMVLGGDGIERRYMTSPTKCPPKYDGIWDAMLDSKKAKWVDVLTQERMRELYQKSRVMFDPSFSKNYNKMGAHFNRSVFEAYNAGTVPVCMEQNMQIPELFQNGVTHIGVPAGASPKKIAAILDRAANMDADEASAIIEAGRAVLKKHFHREVVAQGLIDLSEGKKCGVYGVKTGKPSKRMAAATQNILDGGRPKDRVL